MSDTPFNIAAMGRTSLMPSVLALMATPARQAAKRWRRRRAEQVVADIEPRLLVDAGLDVERYLHG